MNYTLFSSINSKRIAGAFNQVSETPVARESFEVVKEEYFLAADDIHEFYNFYSNYIKKYQKTICCQKMLKNLKFSHEDTIKKNEHVNENSKEFSVRKISKLY